MPENRKSVVVDIVSDSKKFLNGFEEAIKEIEKSAKKANILGNMQDDIDELKQSIVGISKSISNIKPTVDDSSIQKMQEKMESLDNSIKYLKKNVKEIKFDANESSGANLEKQMNSIKNEVSGLISQMREASSFITELFNIKGGITSNSINNATSDLESYKKKLNELKSIQENLKAKDTTIYSKMKFKEAEEELDRYKDKYIELELEISRLNSKIKSGNLQDNEKIIATKKLNSYKLELASVSREIIDIQDRLEESKGFKGEFFDVAALQSNIKAVEKILSSNITSITNRIAALSKETNSVISANTFELKDGKINIPVELDKTATKLKSVLQDVLNELQATVNPITVPIQLVSAYKTNIKNEINELKEIQALQKGIDQLNDESEKKIAQSTLDKIKAQFEKELRIDIKTNIKETQKEIESGLNKIKNILKRANISVYPKFELTEKNKQQLQKKMYKISDSVNIDFSKQFEEIQQELATILDNNQVNSWTENFIHKLDEICNKFKTLTGNNNFINDFINGWSEADKIMSSKHQKESLSERGAYFNSKTGYVSNTFTIGNNNSYDLSEDIFNACLEEVDTFIHSHPEKYAALSTVVLDENNSINGDILSFYYDYLKGVRKQLVRSMEEIEVFDAEKFYSDYSDIFKDINTDPKKFNELSKKLLDAKEEVSKKISNNIWFYLQEIIDEYGRISDTSSLSDALVDNMTPNNSLIVSAISDKFKGKDINSEFLKYLKTGNHFGNLNEEFVKFIFSGFNKVDFDKLINAYSSTGVSQDDYLKVINEFKENISSSFKKYFADTFNLPSLDWDDFGQINYRMATPEILEKALGIKDFDKYTKVYSNKEWNEDNPLGLKNNTLSGIFDNTGIENLNNQFPDLLSNIKAIENAINSVSNILREVFNISSELELDNQFENVRKRFYEIANIDGSFDARKKGLKELISEYQKYLDMGGKQPISDLTENEKSQKKLLELLNKQISVQNELQQVGVKQSSADLKINQEIKEISNLSNVIDDVVKNINDKTEAFKQEQKVVSSIIPDETEKIGKLVSALTNVKKILEDISISSKGLDLSNLSNLGQLNKLKADKINTISTSIKSLAEGINGLDIKDGNILNSLQGILNKANELKDLASILKSTTSQINAVKGNTKTQSAQNLLTGSEDTIRDLGILNLENQNLTTLSTSLKATSKGTVELIALVQDLKGNFQEYTLSTTNGIDFTTIKVEEGTNSVEKQALTWKKLHELISQQPNNISMDFIDETSELWKDVSNAAENYKNELGEIVSITRSIRQDKDGNALESFKIMGSSGNSVTIGAELENVALKQRVDDGSYEKTTKHNQDIIAAYKERNKQTKEYYELLEKVKSDTATDTELERLNQIVEQWDKAINKKDEYNIQSGGDSKVEADARKIQDEFINSQSLDYSSMADKYVQGAKTILNKLSQYNFTDDFQVKINEASEIINKLQSKLPLDLINDQDSIKDVGVLKNLMSDINSGWKVDSNRISNETAFYKLQGKIADTLKENSAMSSKLKNDFRELQQEMERWGSSIPTNELKKLSSRFFELDTEMKRAGKTGRSFFDMVTNKAKHMSSAFIGQYLSLYDFIRYAQQAYQYVADIDKQMIELEKVSDMSASRLAESFDHAKESAKDLGSTVSDVISATADWSRLGYNADEAEQLAEVATIYKNVGDGIDISTANESLISTLQGFQMEASQAMEIVDSFNEVANRMPIDSAGIGEALQRSAASFNAANTDLNSSIALITATNAVIQDPTSVGTMWKTVSARIRGAKAELEEAGLETDGMVESTSKLRDLVKGMTGFDIMEDEDTFKSIYDIMVGIGEEWENLSDIDQAALLEALAGKRAGNALAAALQNVDMLKEAYQIAEGSSGSAMKEQEKWEQGLEARTNKLKASLETLSTTVLDSDFLGGAIDAGRTFIDVLTEIIDTFGLFPTLLTAGGGIFAAMKSFKGEGRVKKFALMNMPSVA